MDAAGWTAVAYALSTLIAFAFAAYAVAFGWLTTHRAKDKVNVDTEFFVTARSTQSKWRIGWSFFAGAVGAWVISAPSQFAASLGIVGVAVYAITAGLPILMIAAFGARITRALPHVLSLSDYIGWRYGPIAKTIIVSICCLNMSIALLAEYSAIGSIFSSFVNGMSWPIILVVGVLTLIYTAYGGLVVSIATDQVQGIAASILTVVLVVYVAVTYRIPIPSPLPEGLGPNYYGYVSIFTLGVSLATATVFSEAMWQRVWASDSQQSLYFASIMGCILIILVVFLSGFGGWLALVGGLATEDTDYNIILMQVLNSSEPNSVASLNSVLGLVVVLLAVIMNEGAVDSLQNGLAAAISSMWLKNRPLLWSRIAVVVVNIPLIALGTQGYSVLQVFLVANMICTCAAFPVVIGLWQRGRPYFTETACVFGIAFAILGATATGAGLMWDPSDPGASIANGAYYVWYGNMNYDWPPFMAGLAFSIGGAVLWAAAATAARAAGINGPGISGLLMPIPGMRFITGTPHWGRPDAAVGGGSGSSGGGEGGEFRGVWKPEQAVGGAGAPGV